MAAKVCLVIIIDTISSATNYTQWLAAQPPRVNPLHSDAATNGISVIDMFSAEISKYRQLSYHPKVSMEIAKN